MLSYKTTVNPNLNYNILKVTDLTVNSDTIPAAASTATTTDDLA